MCLAEIRKSLRRSIKFVLNYTIRAYGELKVGSKFHVFLISIVDIVSRQLLNLAVGWGLLYLLNKMLNGTHNPPEHIGVGEKSHLPVGNRTPFV